MTQEAAEPEAVEPQVSAAEPVREPSMEPALPATPITRVESITWSVGADETVVSIVLDGTVSDDSHEVVRIGQGAPREVIKIAGVSSPLDPSQFEVGSEQLLRLRTGVHEGPGGSEIHIVADLAGPAVAVTSVRAEGNTLLITFS